MLGRVPNIRPPVLGRAGIVLRFGAAAAQHPAAPLDAFHFRCRRSTDTHSFADAETIPRFVPWSKNREKESLLAAKLQDSREF